MILFGFEATMSDRFLPYGWLLKLVVDLGFLLKDLCESMLVLRLYVCGS